MASDLLLNELAPAGEGAPDVRITAGPTGAVDGAQGVTVDGVDLVLTITGIARFTVRGGSEIRVEADPSASARNVRLYLLGSVFGALLHQRGLLPLHANAIVIDGRAFAFTGASGAGKSTLAAWFVDRGYRILSDDVCVVGFDAGGFDGRGAAVAQPGLPRLRLWRDALDRGGRDAADYHRSFDELDKYDVPTAADLSPMPLAAVYRLGRGDGGDIARLTGMAAVEALVANTYRGAIVAQIEGGTRRHLAACVALARAVPVFAAERAWGFDRFEAEAARLEAHALGLGAPA